MSNKFTPQLLVKSIEADHQYILPQGFTERYNDFLDRLVDEVARVNQVSAYSVPQKKNL